jgi:hypothetical protein
MNWKIITLAMSLSLLFGAAMARCEVFLSPSCEPQIHFCTPDAKIHGLITAADHAQIKQLFDQLHSQKWSIGGVTLTLDSPGGDVDAAMAIGRIVRREHTAVFVQPQGICFSACVLVLAGGTSRFMPGKVGIHRPYLEVPKEAVSPDRIRGLFQKMLQDLRLYFGEMNVAETLADAMFRIEPENIRVLNESALTGYGLTLADPIAQETDDLTYAQEHGLTRQELMRRKSLVEKECRDITTFPRCYKNVMETGRARPGEAVDWTGFGTNVGSGAGRSKPPPQEQKDPCAGLYNCGR